MIGGWLLVMLRLFMNMPKNTKFNIGQFIELIHSCDAAFKRDIFGPPEVVFRHFAETKRLIVATTKQIRFIFLKQNFKPNAILLDAQAHGVKKNIFPDIKKAFELFTQIIIEESERGSKRRKKRFLLSAFDMTVSTLFPIVHTHTHTLID